MCHTSPPPPTPAPSNFAFSLQGGRTLYIYKQSFFVVHSSENARVKLAIRPTSYYTSVRKIKLLIARKLSK